MKAEEIEIKVFYQLVVDPAEKFYNNPGQFKQGALYPAAALFVYDDDRADSTVEGVARNYPEDWKRLELYFTKDLIKIFCLCR
jgi:hypothetical protein